ncbi:hypothetical protein D3C85_1679840 [compost metagenome]
MRAHGDNDLFRSAFDRPGGVEIGRQCFTQRTIAAMFDIAGKLCLMLAVIPVLQALPDMEGKQIRVGNAGYKSTARSGKPSDSLGDRAAAQ